MCAVSNQHDSTGLNSFDATTEPNPWPHDQWAEKEATLNAPFHDETFEERVLFSRLSIGADEPSILK
eukprot:SAG11_NODE_16640_length_541_cov_14.040724_1_plen_66_part_10